MKIYGLFVTMLIIALIESKPLDRTSVSQMESSFEPTENSMDRNNLDNNDVTTTEINSAKPDENDNISSLLLPILHRWKFTPQTFLQDRLSVLKQTLEKLGFVVPSSNNNNNNNNTTISKQLASTNGLLNLVGLDDSGFYTDRFEPAGFFGGNGWFANKGGILGGPGAILSTGSLLTDYPTPYKK